MSNGCPCPSYIHQKVILKEEVSLLHFQRQDWILPVRSISMCIIWILSRNDKDTEDIEWMNVPLLLLQSVFFFHILHHIHHHHPTFPPPNGHPSCIHSKSHSRFLPFQYIFLSFFLFSSLSLSLSNFCKEGKADSSIGCDYGGIGTAIDVTIQCLPWV